MRTIWMRKAYGAILPQIITFHVELRADVAPVRPLPIQQRIEKLLIRHALLQQTSHFTLSGHTESHALSVVNARVLHIRNNRRPFPSNVNSNFLESAPTVLQHLQITQNSGV